MATVRLSGLNGNAVVVAAETDNITGLVVALVGRNATDRPARFTLDRLVGDTLDVRIPPNTTVARRTLTVPIERDAVLGALLGGVQVGLSHPVP